MHGSAVDATAKRTSREDTKPRLDGYEHDALQCDTIRNKDMTGQSYTNNHEKLAIKETTWCCLAGLISD